MTRKEALLKLRKMLALAERNSSENESNLALVLAKDLARKFGFTIKGFQVELTENKNQADIKHSKKSKSSSPTHTQKPKKDVAPVQPQVALSPLAERKMGPRSIESFLGLSRFPDRGELDFVFSSRRLFVKNKWGVSFPFDREPFFKIVQKACLEHGPHRQDLKHPIDINFENFILGLIAELDRVLEYREAKKTDLLYVNEDRRIKKSYSLWFKRGEEAAKALYLARFFLPSHIEFKKKAA